MDNIPLCDASMSEVLARVSYQLIRRREFRQGYKFQPDTCSMGRFVAQLDKAGWRAISFWVGAYNARLAEGELPAFTRTAFIMRARLGMDFRSVAYFAYKAKRRADPRIT